MNIPVTVINLSQRIIVSKPVFFNQNSNKFGYVRLQLRSAFHNSRRGARKPVSEPNPIENIHIEGPLNASGLLKPFFFTVGVTSLSLAGCVIWEYENLRSHASTFLKRPGQWLNAHHKRVSANNRSEPGPIKKWWSSLRESEKVFYPILAANILVFGAWRIRPLQPFMIKYFCSNPSGSAKCLPMVLSTFSHYSTLHLAANMYVLYSFMPAAIASLGKEQFVAMYLSAGVISSFASFLYKVVVCQPGLSLGASGAIMSILSYVCVQYPDTRLSIIFLPMFTFAAGTAIKVIMSVDLAGVIMGWKFFDHAAHLGGALFGMAWCYWGNMHVWGNRDKFLQYYHSIRKDS
ncbi:presenilins-associated rhomboid-like protein, mitochondrial isoform X1 [Pararge aegeria]|uniref:presenilins-associated rhomboid-like protein, mitochondrial isoform X1 n=1 Tax=Pararge aegeria TaxID=116150 RepID=UPI0019D1C669|nr:presenilins-associated rhomboid-like protein, mitochondrial isoform X1 [Pararge aegeria]